MQEHHRFPASILIDLRAHPENLKCFDCLSAEHDWASVSNGIFICLTCAGRHRALGVNVSFVRSLHMDTWNDSQVEMMRQGGNRQFRLFLESLDIHRPSIEVLYHSKAASLYRSKLKKQVDGLLNGRPIGVTIAQSLEHNYSTHVDPWHDAGTHHGHPMVVRYAVSFPEGPMGMTVTKDPADNRAYVSRILEGSAAQSGGVQVGDFVDGVAGKFISDFDIIMHMIPLMRRPVQLMLSRVTKRPAIEVGAATDDDAISEYSPSKADHVHPLVHTFSSPALAGDTSTATKILSGSPRRRRRKTERMAIAVLRSDSMMAYEQDSDSDDGDRKLSLQSSFAFSAKFNVLSTSLETGLASTQSTPTKSPRMRFHRHLNSASDEVKSDSESVYCTPGSVSHSSHRRRCIASPINVTKINDDLATDFPYLIANNVSDVTPTCDRKKSDDEDDSFDVLSANVLSSPLVKKCQLKSGSLGDVPVMPIFSDSNDISLKRSASEPNNGETVGVFNPPNLAAQESSGRKSAYGEYVLRLKRGLAVRVFNSTTEKWEAGFIQRQHRDGTFKILLEDGHAEPHIASDRIAITRDMLRSVSSFASSFESHNSVSSTPGDSDGGFPRQQSGDVDVSSHSKDSHLSSFSQNLTRDWLDRVKNGRDSSSKIEFVIEYPGDDIEWMGDSGAEDNDDAKSHESPLTATNIKSQAESGSINKNMDVQTPCSTNTFKVDFPCPPMGFTLNKSVSGHAHVTKITPGGQASCSPVKLGDCVVEINGIVVNGYDDFMKSMLTVTYPALVTFFRKKKAEDTPDSSASQHRAAAAASNSSSMRKDDVTLPDAYKELVQATHAMRTPSGTGTVRPEVSRMQSAPASIGVPKIRSMSPMASKLLMEDTPDTYMVQGELRDVCFSEDGEIGMGLMEKIGYDGMSVFSEVVDVFPGCMAQKIGVEIGCIVIAVDSKPYESHAHTVSALKNSKRPITVKFLYPSVSKKNSNDRF